MGFCRCHIVKTSTVLLLVGRCQFYKDMLSCFLCIVLIVNKDKKIPFNATRYTVLVS